MTRSAASFVLLVVLSLPLKADYLFMADGSIVECDIVKQKTLSVIIKKKNSVKTETVSGYDILRVRQTKLWQERRWIRNADGALSCVYIVDANASSWLVRSVLESPKETVVERGSAVLLEPSPANGSVTVSVSAKTAILSWKGEGLRRIYLRKKDEPFRLAGESSSGSLTLSGLPGSTRFEAVMTSELPGGAETAQSGPFAFTIPDTPPLPPSALSCAKQPGALLLSWEGDSDEDGVVVRYDVYLRDGKMPEKIGTTQRNFLSVPCDPSEHHRFSVVSVDDAGMESAQSGIVESRKPVFVRYSLCPSFILPLGAMRDDFRYGYGARMRFELPDSFVGGLGLGCTTGFLMFEGKGTVRRGDAVPLCLRASYELLLGERLSLSGAFEPGIWYLSKSDETQRKSSSLSPAAELHFSGQYALSEKVLVSLSAGGGCVRCRGSVMPYALAGAAFTMVL